MTHKLTHKYLNTFKDSSLFFKKYHSKVAKLKTSQRLLRQKFLSDSNGKDTTVTPATKNSSSKSSQRQQQQNTSVTATAKISQRQTAKTAQRQTAKTAQ